MSEFFFYKNISLSKILAISSALMFSVLFLGLMVTPVGDTDVYIHLRDGRQWVENGLHTPTENFSYAKPRQMVERIEIPFRVALFLLWKWQGYNALTLFKAFVLLLAVFFLAMAAYQRYRNIVLVLFCFSATLIVNTLSLHPLESYLHIRPYIFTYLFIPVIFIWLEHFSRLKKIDFAFKNYGIWFVPVLVWVWANFHPGFVVVFVLFSAYWLETLTAYWRAPSSEIHSKIMLLSLVMLASFLAGAVNPLGFGIYTLITSTAQTQEYMQMVTEWMPASFGKIPHFYIYLALLGLLLLANIKKTRLSNLFIAVFFGYMGTHSFRHVVLAYFATLPVFCDEIGKLKANITSLRFPKWVYPSSAALLTIILLVLSISLLPAKRIYNLDVRKDHVPGRALDWLETHHVSGNLFATYGWGAFINWHTNNRFKVFMDGLLDHYSLDLFHEDLDMEYGTSRCLATLEKYGIDIIMVRPQGPSGVYNVILPTGKWALIYFDEVCDVFVLRNEKYRSLIAQYEYHDVDPLKSPFYDPQHIKESLQEMDRAIADSPDSYVPLFLKANLLLNLGQTDEALKDLAEVKRLNPDHLGTFYTLGSYFLSTSQYEFAEQNFQQVLQLTDDSKLKAQMAFNLAVCYQRQAQYGQALSWARRALKNHPDPDRVRAFVNYLENATRSPN